MLNPIDIINPNRIDCRYLEQGKSSRMLKLIFIGSVCMIFACKSSLARNIHRPVDDAMPSITSRWAGGSRSYTLRNDHLEEHAFFKLYDKNYFERYFLPKGMIAFRYELGKSVDSKIIQSQIDGLIGEIKARKHKYSDFLVLQSKDFNRRRGHGLLILKFKKYPFVVKLFIERPETFVSPYHKGFEPVFFFYLGGGMNRHLAGFTRVKNLEIVREKIAASPLWKSRVDTPRKWYLLPTDTPWIEIVGRNMGPARKTLNTKIPGTYCIIADAIEAEHTMSMFDTAENKETIMELCNYLNLFLDPHLNNYMIEKGTGKIVLVDTEHFATVVGFKEPVQFDSYIHWYLHLAGKFMHNTFGQSKKERRNHRLADPEMTLC